MKIVLELMLILSRFGLFKNGSTLELSQKQEKHTCFIEKEKVFKWTQNQL